MITVEEIKKLKVAELKEECKNLGLSTDGRKQDLIDRLEAAITENATTSLPVAEPAQPATLKPAPQQPTPTPAAQAPAAGQPLSEEEKRKLRAAKFGTAHLPEADKKKLRAERFGTAPAAAAAAAKPVWKPAGVVKPSAPIPLAKAMSVEELERRKARAAKYGTAPPTQAEEEAAKRLARAMKYGTVDETTKRAMRAQRFNNGKEDGAKGPPPAKKPRPEGQVA